MKRVLACLLLAVSARSDTLLEAAFGDAQSAVAASAQAAADAEARAMAIAMAQGTGSVAAAVAFGAKARPGRPSRPAGARGEVFDALAAEFAAGRPIAQADIDAPPKSQYDRVWQSCYLSAAGEPGLEFAYGLSFDHRSGKARIDDAYDRPAALEARWRIAKGELINDGAMAASVMGGVPLPAMARFARDGSMIIKSTLQNETYVAYCAPYNSRGMLPDLFRKLYVGARDVTPADLVPGRRWEGCMTIAGVGSVSGNGFRVPRAGALVRVDKPREQSCAFRNGRLECLNWGAEEHDITGNTAVVHITNAGNLVLEMGGGRHGLQNSGHAWCEAAR